MPRGIAKDPKMKSLKVSLGNQAFYRTPEGEALKERHREYMKEHGRELQARRKKQHKIKRWKEAMQKRNDNGDQSIQPQASASVPPLQDGASELVGVAL